ncbi:hypothetical protein DSO57_1017920 [Entomophthora muscae]|uniref:Uncharacterized protein n=1 Tax=Entomophthora muscae TaxID=34485 RepID=A0ACC2S6F2_9FUNG|nr:hypothetical protein DSO57_1017920 [Entomophthora muscae]
MIKGMPASSNNKIKFFHLAVKAIKDKVHKEAKNQDTIMLQKDMSELSGQVGDMDKELCQSITNYSQYFHEIEAQVKPIDQGHRQTEAIHHYIKAVKDQCQNWQHKNEEQLKLHTQRIKVLEDNLLDANLTINTVSKEVQIQNNEVCLLQKQIKLILESSCAQGSASHHSQESRKRCPSTLSSASQAPSEDVRSFHSYESDKGNMGHTTHKVFAAEPVLDSSKTPLPGAAASSSHNPLNPRDATSEAQFHTLNNCNTFPCHVEALVNLIQW